MKRLYSGVYQILNTVNNKCYIGSSINIKTRWKEHIYALLKNYNSRHLQRAWNKYKESAFKFKVLFYCRKEVLLQKEQEMIDYYKASNSLFGYNLRIKAASNLGIKHSEEAKRKHRAVALRGCDNPSNRVEVKQKISKANKGKIRSLETREKLSKIVKEHHLIFGHPCLGTHHSEETKRKMSEKAKGRISPNKGKHLSDESRRKMSESRKGRIITPEWRKKLSISGKRIIKTPEWKQKLSEAATKRWAKFRMLKTI